MDVERISEIHINEFPNEVLEMIFNRLPFVDLLRATLVCTRWCSVISSLCSHRILLRVRTKTYVDDLERFRHHKHIAIDFVTLGKGAEGQLEYLKKVAPTLETLVINIRANMVPQLAKLNLNNLVELRLKLSYGQIKDTQQLHQFIGGLTRLKVVKIRPSTIVIPQIPRCIYSLNNIEKLELSTDHHRVEIAGICSMTSLVELAIGAVHYPPEDTVRPLPSLKKLTLRSLQPKDVSKLQVMFFNVTSLDIINPISYSCLCKIMNSWPMLERLNVRGALLYAAKDLCRLPDLRWLKLEIIGRSQCKEFTLRSSFHLLDMLLRIRSLEQLYIVGHGDISVPGRNPRCQLF